MLNACGAFQVRETLSASGPWSVARAADQGGREVRLTMLQLPETLSDADVSRVVSAFQRSLAARTTAAPLPSLLSIVTGGVEQGVLYLAEAMPASKSVRETVAASGPAPADQVVPLLHSLASALDPLHAAATTHGWLCPDNVFVEGSTVLLGGQIWSGVLSMLGELTRGNDLPEAAYLAPEVRSGQAPDARSEAYSTAALAAFMLTGQIPDSMLSRAGELSAPLAAALRKSLDPVPDARHNGIKEMMVEVAVEQAISTPDISDSQAIPEGGDVPDWARELLHQATARRSSGQPVVDTLPASHDEPARAPALPKAPVATPPVVPAPTMPPPAVTAARPAAPPVAAPPPVTVQPPPLNSPVFNWGESSRSKPSVGPVLMGSLAVVLVLVAIALTLLR